MQDYRDDTFLREEWVNNSDHCVGEDALYREYVDTVDHIVTMECRCGVKYVIDDPAMPWHNTAPEDGVA